MDNPFKFRPEMDRPTEAVPLGNCASVGRPVPGIGVLELEGHADAAARRDRGIARQIDSWIAVSAPVDNLPTEASGGPVSGVHGQYSSLDPPHRNAIFVT
jgi:hypothetical protein